jgi:predicted ATPase
MITRVQVKNYRSIADVDVSLGPLTVLVGRNGTGKSTFLDVLRFVRDALRHGLDDAILNRHGITALRRWSPRKPYDVEITLTVEEPDFWGKYSFVIGSGRGGAYRVKREHYSFGKTRSSLMEEYEIKERKWISLPDFLKAGRSNLPLAEPNFLSVPKAVMFVGYQAARIVFDSVEGNFYNISPDTLREPQKPSDERILREDGANLASVLRQIKRDKMWLPDLIAALGRVTEGITDIRVSPAGGYMITELKHEDISKAPSANNKAPWFSLAQESDGTLRMLAMLVALYQSGPYQTPIGLEEPENALHPGALAVLSDVLREAALRNQIIITTQSPDLISHFTVDELRIVEREHGITQIGPIDEIQRETIEEELFSSSDLLRIQDLRREPTEAR